MKFICIISLTLLFTITLSDPSINNNNANLWQTLLNAPSTTTNLTSLQTLDICLIQILGESLTPQQNNFTLAQQQNFGGIKRNTALGKMYFYGQQKLIGFQSTNVQPIQQIIPVKDFFYRLWAGRYYMYSTTLNWLSATTSLSTNTIDQTLINLQNINDMASTQNYYSFISNFTVQHVNATSSNPELLCASLNFIEQPTNNQMSYNFCTETLTFPLQSVLNGVYGINENSMNQFEQSEEQYLHRLTRKEQDHKKIYL